jgi:hypothetical protein
MWMEEMRMGAASRGLGDVAVEDDLAAVAGAKAVEGGVEPALFGKRVVVLGGEGFGDHGGVEKGRSMVGALDEAGEGDADPGLISPIPIGIKNRADIFQSSKALGFQLGLFLREKPPRQARCLPSDPDWKPVLRFTR